MHRLTLTIVELHWHPLHEFFAIFRSLDPDSRSRLLGNLIVARVVDSKVPKKISVIGIHPLSVWQSCWNRSSQAVRISFSGCHQCRQSTFLGCPQDNSLSGAQTSKVGFPILPSFTPQLHFYLYLVWETINFTSIYKIVYYLFGDDNLLNYESFFSYYKMLNIWIKK